MAKESAALRDAVLATGSFKSQTDGFFLYLFEGTPPDECEDATTGATLLVKITAAAAASLHWGTPADGVLPKATAEVWESIITTSGTAQFYRIGLGVEDVTTADATKKRIQGTIGGPGSNPLLYDLIMSNPVLVANGVNTQGFTIFNYIYPTA